MYLCNIINRNIWTTILTPFEPLFLKFTSIFGFFGFSFVVCLLNDLINLITIHTYFIYKFMMLFYRYTQKAIGLAYKIMKDKKTD